MESITLYCRENGSDKVYQASLQPQEQGYLVNFAYGRRGSTLTTGSKTPVPVSYVVAKTAYDRLVRQKLANGYTQGPALTESLQHQQQKPTGLRCMLLNPVAEDELEDLLQDHVHWMQEKMDGRRMLLQKQGKVITSMNRLGVTFTPPETIQQSAAQCHEDFILDGEAVGDVFHVFDILSLAGEDLRQSRFATRYFQLRDFLRTFRHTHIKLVESYCAPEKEPWFQTLKEQGKEGVVFRHMDAAYTPGRANAGGPCLKHKFYETASFVVAKSNDKRSVSLLLFEGDKIKRAGNVTIPPNHAMPKAGSVVECRYLYAFWESGSIYQPDYLGVREDIRAAECTTDQLKYKAEPTLVTV